LLDFKIVLVSCPKSCFDRSGWWIPLADVLEPPGQSND